MIVDILHIMVSNLSKQYIEKGKTTCSYTSSKLQTSKLCKRTTFFSERYTKGVPFFQNLCTEREGLRPWVGTSPHRTLLSTNSPDSCPPAQATKTEWTGNSPVWKRVIAWERSRAASGYGIIWGDADRNIQGGIFSAECHSVDCSGDSKVLTELQIATRSRLLF